MVWPLYINDGSQTLLPDVLKALTRIILMQHNKDEPDEASRLKKCIERLEFVFLLVVIQRILD